MTEQKAPHLRVVENKDEPKNVTSLTEAAQNRIPLRAILGDSYVEDITSEKANSELPARKASETLVGSLTSSELDMFLQLREAEQSKGKFERQGVRNILHHLGDKIASDGDLNDLSPNDVIESKADDASKHKYFTDSGKFDMLKALFFWNLKQRLGLHDWQIGVRKNFEVVKVKKQSVSHAAVIGN